MAEFRIGRLKFNWRAVWLPSTAYVIDDIVKFGANTYVCAENHISVANENLFYSGDLAGGRWTLHTEGLANRGNWVGNTFYKQNDIVKYGNTQYRVIIGYTSGSAFNTYNSNNDLVLEEYLQSFNFENTWNSGTEYQVGDVVTYGGYSYVAKTLHTDKPPATHTANDWDILTTGFNVIGEWNSGTNYLQGDVVVFGGSSFVAVVNNNNNSPSAGGASVWKLVVEGITWKGNWDYATTYKKGEAVKRLSNSYISVNGSGNLNQDPATDANGTYWNVLVEGAANNVMQTEGDLVYYTSGATRLPAGSGGEVLSISHSGVPHWQHNSTTHAVYYVTEEGSDVNDGSNITQAFGTLKHACGIATGPATIYVKAGQYHEQLPIIVPEEVSIVGDNLRTSRIKPDTGDSHYQEITLSTPPSSTHTVSNATYTPATGDMELTIGDHLFQVDDSIKIADESITFSCNFGGASGAAAEKSYPRPMVGGQSPDYVTGKHVKVIAVTGTTITVNVNKKRGQAISNSDAHTFVSATPNGITKSEFVVSLGKTLTNASGTKTCMAVKTNYHENIIHILPLTGGLWTTSDQWKNTDGGDIAITNIVTRPNTESNMFLMSDKTMLKDLLMEGLTGFVPASQAAQLTGSINGSLVTGTGFFPDLVGTTVSGTNVTLGTKVNNFISENEIEVDKVQTVSSTVLTFTATPDDPNNATVKGVYVALNPATPIIKSPYVSNCSCKSSGGVGAIVDGGVHRQFAEDGINPSNKSIVMDSFTQIHDGGMGFWITDGGTSELVSSFTYYCHISYASTRGGRIRSLAGNSSWGNYGIVSSGYKSSEKAQQGTIEGLIIEHDETTRVGNVNGFSLNERVRGQTSQALGYINSVQGTKKQILYTSLITAGPVSVGGTGFQAGETIEGLSSGVTADLIASNSSNRGQDGRTLVVAGLTTAVIENGSVQFVTGNGNGGHNNNPITGADPFTFVISGVSRVGADGRGSITIDRGQWSTTGAAHTGAITNIVQYPNQTSSTATLLTPLYSNETTINVSTITGFNPGEFVLLGGNELCKISSFPTSNSIIVTRASQGAGIAGDYSTGDTIVSIGASTVPAGIESFKDFDAADIQMRVTDASIFIQNDYYKIEDEFVKCIGVSPDQEGLTTLTLVEDKAAQCFDEQSINIRYLFSQARLTGHDFLQVGTGGTTTTNWPDVPTQAAAQSQEINESYPGRVFYVSTDHEGNFRVGRYFRVNQATGSATLNANDFDLSGLTNLQLGSIGAQLGASINEFSTDGTLSQNSPNKCPTQSAVKTYVDTNISDLTTSTNVGIASAQRDALTQAFWIGLSA
tara:strand:+ start:3 stop:3965 length:3963 start_codon:yes stop_codon:yes gene_type:complete